MANDYAIDPAKPSLTSRHLFFWPDWRQLGYATLWGGGELLLFLSIYGGADWLTRQHAYRVRLHSDLDLQVPFVPAMSLAYLSLNVMFWVGPLIQRTRCEIKAMVCTMAVATLVAGVGFVLLPGEQAYTEPASSELGRWGCFYNLARAIALHYNYLPSLHVAFTIICLRIYKTHARRLARLLLSLWSGAIIASTMLIHQHYLLDVVTGWLLGMVAVQQVYLRMMADAPSLTGQTNRPNLYGDQAPLA